MAVVPFTGQRLPPLRAWPPIALSGFLMAVIGNGGVVWAEQYVASGLAAVIVATVPFWTIAVEAFLPEKERVTRRAWAGLGLGFLGIVVLVWPELAFGGRDARMFVYGVVALQIATLGWALGTSYAKRKIKGVSSIGAAAVQMFVSGVMLLAIGTASGEWPHLTFTTRTIAAMIYLVLVGAVVGFSAYLYALKHLPITTVSLYAYINPVIAVLLGTLLLGEPFNLRIVIASTLVLAGVAVTNGRLALRASVDSASGRRERPRRVAERSELARGSAENGLAFTSKKSA